MAKLVEKNGVIRPEEPPPPKERHTFVQQDLIESQLPRYLKRLIDAEASLEAVFQASRPFRGGRYSVVYVHHEKLESEIYT